jgi:hypothetical protein
MYLVGGTSQSSSGVTTYTNKNVYIGTDNCLYSNGKKVATADEIPDLISPPVKGVDYFTEADKEEIVQAVITALGTPVFGRVDENNNIILTGELAGGTYTLKYEDSDGTLTEIGTITAGGEEVPTYTNILATALGYDGTILNGVGYIDGYRLTPSQTVASNLSYLTANSDYFATGFIPYTITDAQNKVPFYIKGVNLDNLANYSYSRVIMASNYNTNEYCEHTLLSNTDANGFTISKLGDKYYKITPNSNFYLTGEWRINNAQYIRFSFPQSSGSGVIITINEPIE